MPMNIVLSIGSYGIAMIMFGIFMALRNDDLPPTTFLYYLTAFFMGFGVSAALARFYMP